MNMFILSVEDSGGPLLIPDGPQGNIAAGIPQHDLIVGVTSFGSRSCGDSAPGVYIGVSYMSDWILGIVDGPEVCDGANSFDHHGILYFGSYLFASEYLGL